MTSEPERSTLPVSDQAPAPAINVEVEKTPREIADAEDAERFAGMSVAELIAETALRWRARSRHEAAAQVAAYDGDAAAAAAAKSALSDAGAAWYRAQVAAKTRAREAVKTILGVDPDELKSAL